MPGKINLAYVKKHEGRQASVNYLIAAFTALLNSFSVDNKMNGEQLVSFCEGFLERNAIYSIPDIRIFVNRCIEGRYGKAYNRLDGPVIYEWWTKYEEERLGEVQEARSLEHAQNKALATKIDREQVNKEGLAKLSAMKNEQVVKGKQSEEAYQRFKRKYQAEEALRIGPDKKDEKLMSMWFSRLAEWFKISPTEVVARYQKWDESKPFYDTLKEAFNEQQNKQ